MGSVARLLRQAGKTVDVFPDPAKQVKKAFDYADRRGAIRVAFVAPSEWEKQMVRIKDLRNFGQDAPDTDKQKDVPLVDLANVDAYFGGIATSTRSSATPATTTGAPVVVAVAPPATASSSTASVVPSPAPIPSSPAGLEKLLATQPYIAGFRPSAKDREEFTKLQQSSGRPSTPSLLRWYEHIESFTEMKR